MNRSECSSIAKIQTEEILLHLKHLAMEELELEPEDIESLEPDTPIVEGLKLDSLTQVVLITGIEEYYGFEFEPEDRDALETLADLVATIQARATRRGVHGDHP